MDQLTDCSKTMKEVSLVRTAPGQEDVVKYVPRLRYRPEQR